MTGTFTLRYQQSTPLGSCSGEEWIDSVDGAKTIGKGELRRADGETTVRAEGVFILPRWAREALEEHHRKRRGSSRGQLLTRTRTLLVG